MGYTQYWDIREELTQDKFAKWSEGVKVIVQTAIDAGIALGNGHGVDSPEVAENLVCFNGKDENGHETFTISFEDMGFGFCKTAGKPYDSVVTASLIYAKEIFGDAIVIKSDGNWDDWESGQLLYETVFDIQPESVLS